MFYFLGGQYPIITVIFKISYLVACIILPNEIWLSFVEFPKKKKICKPTGTSLSSFIWEELTS